MRCCRASLRSLQRVTLLKRMAAPHILNCAHQTMSHFVHANNDGSPMKLGRGAYAQTLYCGQYKTTGPPRNDVLKNCFAGKCPDDGRCGPDDGIQCIACQIVQDRKSTSQVSLDNCHEEFLEMFQQNLTAGHVNNVLDDPDYRPQFRAVVCREALNANRSSKVVFATALEMLQEFCDAGEQFKVICIHKANITTEACRCHVDMSCGKLEFSLRINCSYYQGPVDNFIVLHPGWTGSYVNSSFELGTCGDKESDIM